MQDKKLNYDTTKKCLIVEVENKQEMKKNLKTIISNEDMQILVKKKEAEYINWGQKRGEIAYVGKNIYWKHTASHYHILGEVVKDKSFYSGANL